MKNDRPVFVTGVGCGLQTVPASLCQSPGPKCLHVPHCFSAQQTGTKTAQSDEWQDGEYKRLRIGKFSLTKIIQCG